MDGGRCVRMCVCMCLCVFVCVRRQWAGYSLPIIPRLSPLSSNERFFPSSKRRIFLQNSWVRGEKSQGWKETGSGREASVVMQYCWCEAQVDHSDCVHCCYTHTHTHACTHTQESLSETGEGPRLSHLTLTATAWQKASLSICDLVALLHEPCVIPKPLA